MADFSRFYAKLVASMAATLASDAKLVRLTCRVLESGPTAQGRYRFDTTLPGNGNAGHTFGTQLSNVKKRELIG